MGILLVWAGAAEAQKGPIQVELMVSQISSGGSGIDPRGRELHEKLKGQLSYDSLEVLEVKQLSLAVDQVGSVALPDGKKAKVRPLNVDGGSALLAVEIEGAVQTDLRVRKGHWVVIGAERYRDGKLVISLRSRW
jgi:hypothetical protein